MLNNPTGRDNDPAPSLQSMLTRYAIRYHIAGRERDLLVERTARLLAANPEAILDQPVEKVVAELMHRTFLEGIKPVLPVSGPEKQVAGTLRASNETLRRSYELLQRTDPQRTR